MKRVIKLVAIAVGFAFISYYGILGLNISSPAHAESSGKSSQEKAPGFKLKNLDGKDVNLSDYKGKVVILDFWATWCPPCRMEIPHFIDLQKTYEKQGFSVVGIAIDQGGVNVVKPFYEKNKMNYPVLIGTYDVTEAYGGVRGIPTAFVIDREGNIYKKYIGYRDKKVFEEDIKTLLAKKQ